MPNLNQEVEAVQTTVTGQFDVNNFDTSSFDVTEVDEASEYFAMAIEESLEANLTCETVHVYVEASFLLVQVLLLYDY